MAEHSSRRSIYRQAALDRIASQERLDVLNDVTSAPYWIVLCVVGSLLAGAILWGIFGSLPIQVRGEGILIQGGEVIGVAASEPGMILSISVAPGDLVKMDQEVARLSHNDAARELDKCLREVAVAEPEAEGMIKRMRGQLSELEHRKTKVADLVRQGLKAHKDLLPINGEILAVLGEIQAQQQRVRALRENCKSLRAMIREDSVIRARAAGKVIDVAVRAGDTVQATTQILTLEPQGPLQATIFVPVRDGKRLRTLMSARVSPSHIRPEEHGYMLARVRSYSAFPATPEALNKVLRNEGLVKRLSEQGPLFRVMLDLQEDRRSPSGFLWTGKGPSEPIESGTVASASVIVDRRRPVSYVIPLVRQTLGMSGS